MSKKVSFSSHLRIVFVFVAIIALLFLLAKDNAGTQIGNQKFNLQTATTDEQMQIGLSGRESLGKNEGMIFVNDSEKEMCMWMKDMKFNLSIIWVENAEVSYIEPDISPDSYPQTFCHKANQVIEINTADLAGSGLKVGDKLSL